MTRRAAASWRRRSSREWRDRGRVDWFRTSDFYRYFDTMGLVPSAFCSRSVFPPNPAMGTGWQMSCFLCHRFICLFVCSCCGNLLDRAAALLSMLGLIATASISPFIGPAVAFSCGQVGFSWCDLCLASLLEGNVTTGEGSLDHSHRRVVLPTSAWSPTNAGVF